MQVQLSSQVLYNLKSTNVMVSFFIRKLLLCLTYSLHRWRNRRCSTHIHVLVLVFTMQESFYVNKNFPKRILNLHNVKRT